MCMSHFFLNNFIPQHQPSSTLLMFKDLQQAPLGIEDPLGIEAFLGVFMVFSGLKMEDSLRLYVLVK